MGIINNVKEAVMKKAQGIVESENMELVEGRVFQFQGRYTLRCLVDYPQGGVTLGDCAKVNRKLFSFLEESGILGDDFVVEINSPGLDRTLKSRQDFARVQGRMILLWLNEPAEGKEYFEGEVERASTRGIDLKLRDKILKINYEQIKAGKEKVK